MHAIEVNYEVLTVIIEYFKFNIISAYKDGRNENCNRTQQRGWSDIFGWKIEFRCTITMPQSLFVIKDA